MSAEPAYPQDDSLDQLTAALRADFAGVAEPATNTPEVVQRLIEAEAQRLEMRDSLIAARREMQWKLLMEAQFEVSNCAGALDLILRDDKFDDAEFPNHISGPLFLVRTMLTQLSKRMGEAL